MKRRAPSPEKTGSPELRPVGARALKSAIDTLRPHLFGSRVLDLFAGQGRFGMAALEEGAESVEFVERDKKSAKKLETELRDNAKASVNCEDVFQYLRESTGHPFDLIFADPPFPLWVDEDFAHRLGKGIQRVAARGSILLVKSPSRMVLSVQIPGFIAWKEKEFGESNLLYFREHSAGA